MADGKTCLRWQLTAFAETAKVCRHISICRFFGENIDEKNPTMLAAYCAGMCDVRLPDAIIVSPSHPY